MNSWHVQQLKFAFGIGGFMSFYGIVMGIVLFGDKVGINVPQKGVVIALILLSIPFALLIGYVSSRRSKKKEAAAKAEAEAKAGEKPADEQAAKAAPTTAADNADFKQRTEELVQFLKSSNLAGAGNAVYSLPWYIVAGNIKSGKSSLVMGSELTFQTLPSQRQSDLKAVRPTKAVDWRVTNDAVFIDTSGAFQVESDDAGEWTALIDTIKKYRSNRPLDGFILTVNTDKILNGDERETEEMAKVLRTKLDEVTQKFRIRFPVYLVFTKADSIEGFSDSFSVSKQEGKNLVWGATIPLEKADNGQAMFDGEFELLQNSLMKRRLMRLSAPFPPMRQLRIFNFPLHFGSARRKLGAFVSTLFKPNPFSENPFLRGFYFTASPAGNTRQGGAPTVGQTFFTEKLFRDVILRDKDLVKTFEEQKQKPPILGWILTALGAFVLLFLLLMGTISLFNNKAMVADAGKKGEEVLAIVQNDANINPLDKKPDEAETEIKAIDRLQQKLKELDKYDRDCTLKVICAPWLSKPILGWGLYSGDRLYREKLLPIYFNAVERRFKTPTVNKIKQDLQKFAASNPVANPAKLTPDEEKNLGENYDLLKAYLMLTGEYKERANEAEITNVLKKYWAKESKTPTGLEGVSEDILIFWAKQIDRQEAPPVGFPRIPFDEDARTLVTSVRKKLQVFPATNRYYKLKVTEISKTIDENVGAVSVTGILARNNANTNFVEGKYQIPGAYTIEGFRLMKVAINEADKKLSEDDWVMGEEGKKDVAAQSGGATKVQELYFRDYIDHWNNFIKDARVKPYTVDTAKPALEEFTQKTSPVMIIVKEVARNTDFTGKKAAASGGFFSGIVDTIKGWFSSKEDLGTGGNSDVEVAFRPLSNFVGDAEAKDAPIGKYQNQITLVNNKFSKFDQNKINQVSAEFAKSDFKNFTELGTARDKVETELKPFNEPATAQVFADFLRQPLGNLSALLGEKGKGEITKLWAEAILPKAQEAFKGFPFEDNTTEANIKALEEFLNPTESGILTKFFNENLKNDFKEANGQLTTLTPDKYNPQFVEFLNKAFILREKLFGKTSATIKYGYTFELQAPADLTVSGTVDGEAIEAAKAKNISFPAGQGRDVGVNIIFGASETAATPTPTPSASPTSSPSSSPTPAKSPTGTPPIEYKMQWGLFRMFKDGGATMQANGYNLVFNRGDKKLTIIIKPSGSDIFENNFKVFKDVRSMPQAILK